LFVLLFVGFFFQREIAQKMLIRDMLALLPNWGMGRLIPICYVKFVPLLL
jgi:hypothetical protein